MKANSLLYGRRRLGPGPSLDNYLAQQYPDHWQRFYVLLLDNLCQGGYLERSDLNLLEIEQTGLSGYPAPLIFDIVDNNDRVTRLIALDEDGDYGVRLLELPNHNDPLLPRQVLNRKAHDPISLDNLEQFLIERQQLINISYIERNLDAKEIARRIDSQLDISYVGSFWAEPHSFNNSQQGALGLIDSYLLDSSTFPADELSSEMIDEIHEMRHAIEQLSPRSPTPIMLRILTFGLAGEQITEWSGGLLVRRDLN